MTIPKISSSANAPKPLAKAIPASESPSQAKRDSDSLTLSLGTSTERAENAVCVALLKEGMRLDGLGYYEPALERFNEAIRSADSLDTLATIKNLLDKNEANYEPYFAIHAANKRALEIVEKWSVEATPAAYLAETQKLKEMAFESAAKFFYQKAINASDSFDELVNIADSTSFSSEDVDKKAAKLAKELPAMGERGDATAMAYLAKAESMNAKYLTKTAVVFYLKGIEAAETRDSLYAIKKAADLHGLTGGIHSPVDVSGAAESKLWRMEHPFRWWNPGTWMHVDWSRV